MSRALTPPDWEQAVCRSVDSELFFPDDGGYGNASKRICGGCPIKDACLEYAIANREQYGIWGGLGPRARRRIANAA